MPPLPGQTLPPSPRALRREAQAPASPAFVGGPTAASDAGNASESPTQEVPRG